MVALLSSVIVTFLCLRLRKHKSSHNHDSLSVSGSHLHHRKQPENAAAYVIGGGTSADFRPRIKSEYVHSAQARIP